MFGMLLAMFFGIIEISEGTPSTKYFILPLCLQKMKRVIQSKNRSAICVHGLLHVDHHCSTDNLNKLKF